MKREKDLPALIDEIQTLAGKAYIMVKEQEQAEEKQQQNAEVEELAKFIHRLHSASEWEKNDHASQESRRYDARKIIEAGWAKRA